MKIKNRRTGIVVLLLTFSNLFPQDAKKDSLKIGWNNRMVGILNLTQSKFDNWQQGGENSVAWQLNVNSEFIYEQTGYSWKNTGNVSFGMIKLAAQESRKSVDEIRLGTVLTYKVSQYVNPYVSATGETQFIKGYNYADDQKTEISNFMDPAFLMQSAGFGYSSSPAFTTRLGAALKETITENHPQYADDPDTPEIEETRVEFGAESVSDLRKKLAENLLLTSRLELFSNFAAFNEIDVRWDNMFSAQVAKYMDVNLNIKIFYDRDISRKRQIKQVMALGLTYSFI